VGAAVIHSRTPEQLSAWVDAHEGKHERLRERYVSRELYDRDMADLKADLERVQQTLSRAVWAIVSLVVAVLANLIAIWGGRV
jgi:hypothetical protein